MSSNLHKLIDSGAEKPDLDAFSKQGIDVSVVRLPLSDQFLNVDSDSTRFSGGHCCCNPVWVSNSSPRRRLFHS
jgi:hypothetical protein